MSLRFFLDHLEFYFFTDDGRIYTEMGCDFWLGRHGPHMFSDSQDDKLFDFICLKLWIGRLTWNLYVPYKRLPNYERSQIEAHKLARRLERMRKIKNKQGTVK